MWLIGWNLLFLLRLGKYRPSFCHCRGLFMTQPVVLRDSSVDGWQQDGLPFVGLMLVGTPDLVLFCPVGLGISVSIYSPQTYMYTVRECDQTTNALQIDNRLVAAHLFYCIIGHHPHSPLWLCWFVHPSANVCACICMTFAESHLLASLHTSTQSQLISWPVSTFSRFVFWCHPHRHCQSLPVVSVHHHCCCPYHSGEQTPETLPAALPIRFVRYRPVSWLLPPIAGSVPFVHP